MKKTITTQSRTFSPRSFRSSYTRLLSRTDVLNRCRQLVNSTSMVQSCRQILSMLVGLVHLVRLGRNTMKRDPSLAKILKRTIVPVSILWHLLWTSPSTHSSYTENLACLWPKTTRRTIPCDPSSLDLDILCEMAERWICDYSNSMRVHRGR